MPAQVVIDHNVRLGEGFIHFTKGENPLVDYVGAVDLPYQWAGRFQRLEGIHDWGEHFVLHLNQVQRVFGDIAGRGCYRSDGLAHKTNLFFRETMGGPTGRKTGYGPRPVLRILTCKNGDHALELLRAGNINSFDASMSMRTLENRGMQHVGQGNVVGKFSGACK